MKNNRLEVHKNSAIIKKKDSSLNFKQAISKKCSKKSNLVSNPSKDKSLKKNKKIIANKNKDLIKNQIKPFLTKNEINNNSKLKNSEKIRNLLKHANNNQLLNNKSNFNNKKYKNKSTTNLCAPTPSKNVQKPKNNENVESNKSPKLNDFINEKNNELNKELNNNQNNVKTNLAFLMAKNQNYDDDSIFLNINESYLDYINNQPTVGKKRNNNDIDKNKNEYLSDDYSIKNNNLDNNDTSTLINSIININKFLTNEVNHKSINKTNSINDNKNKKSKTKPKKVYENQLIKTNQDLNKIKEEEPVTTNNENDKNINNINNNKNSVNNNINSNYQREIINKVMKSKLAYSVEKPLKANLFKKRKLLSLEDIDEDKNYNSTDLYFNTHSPKITTNNEIIKKLKLSPNICSINKTLVNIEVDLPKVKNKNNNSRKERIKVSKAQKYKFSSDNIKNKLMNEINKIKEETYEKSTKSNNTNSSSSNKTNTNKTNSNKSNNHKNNDNKQNNKENDNSKKINEFNLINENVNNLINKIDINHNIDNNNLNYNIFDDDFYNNKNYKRNNNENIYNKDNNLKLNKYLNYIDNFPNRRIKKHKAKHNSSCYFNYPSLNANNKFNTMVNQEKNNFNISNIEQFNNDYLFTQEDEDNNSKIQEIKITLKNNSNLKINNSNPNINVVNVQNSTINICKNKYNIITTNPDENIINNNFRKEYKNKNSSINNSLRNKLINKSLIYCSKTPSQRPKNENNRLNNSNEDIYVKQVFNNNSKFSNHNGILQLEQNEKYKINRSGKNNHQLLKTEENKFNHIKNFSNINELNINMLPSINNYNTPEIEYINSEKDYFNNELNIKLNEKNKILQATNNFSNNLETNKNKSPRIYIKPSQYLFNKNIPLKTEINIRLENKNERNAFFSHKEDNSQLIISSRNNNLNRKSENYFNDIEFINNDKINEKLNKNLILYEMNQTKIKTKAYVKKNRNIYHKTNNNKIKIKYKVVNNINPRITKYYSYFISRKQINKRPCFISKHSKKVKCLPLCKRSFMTKIIYKYIKRVKIDVCFINKKAIKNKSYKNIEDKEKNILDKNENIIKANILDFSLDQNKEDIFEIDNNNHINNNLRNNNQESLGEINLSFSNNDVNAFKCGENNLDSACKEINNLNLINNDTDIKVTFGQENINSNYNYDISTEGRIMNDSFHGRKNRKISNREEIVIKNKKEINASGIIYDNEEQNQDIKISFENEENIKLEIDKKENNSLIINSMKVERLNSTKRKSINSKDVIDFTEKLENIFDKKKSNTDNNKKNIYGGLNIYCSNFNISDKKQNKFPYLNNENDFIK